MTEALLIEREGSVAILTMNLPHRRNALSPALYQGLERHVRELQDDPACRAIVLTGGKHFCAGGELDGLSSVALEMRAAMRLGHRALRAIVGGRLPVIAAVEGAAFGAGLSLAAACDFIVADSQSKFGAVYGKVGLMPDWGALWTLPQRVGLARSPQGFDALLDWEADTQALLIASADFAEGSAAFLNKRVPIFTGK